MMYAVFCTSFKALNDSMQEEEKKDGFVTTLLSKERVGVVLLEN